MRRAVPGFAVRAALIAGCASRSGSEDRDQEAKHVQAAADDQAQTAKASRKPEGPAINRT